MMPAMRISCPRSLGGWLAITAGACLLLQLGSISTARADAIDGSWCLGPRQFTIEGPTIVTPGGRRVSGDYSRHGFAYVSPIEEADGGARIIMVLIDDDTVEVGTKGTNSKSPAQVWHRCKPIS